MDDAQMAEWLGLNAQEAAVIIPKLTPEQRAIYEHMHVKYTEIMLWQAGVSPFPNGVIVTPDRKRRRGESGHG